MHKFNQKNLIFVLGEMESSESFCSYKSSTLFHSIGAFIPDREHCSQTLFANNRERCSGDVNNHPRPNRVSEPCLWTFCLLSVKNAPLHQTSIVCERSKTMFVWCKCALRLLSPATSPIFGLGWNFWKPVLIVLREPLSLDSDNVLCY